MYSKLFLSAILLATPLITEGKYAADSSDDSKVIISTDKSSWTIRGKVIDAQTGEEITGAAVSFQNLMRGKDSDIYYFSGSSSKGTEFREYSEDQMRLGTHLKLDYRAGERHKGEI